MRNAELYEVASWDTARRALATLSTRYTAPATVLIGMPTTPRGPRQPHKRLGNAADAPAPATQQTLVLVAEDEENIAETLAMIVEDAGYVALVANDGRTALALARQHHPHLVITDLMMPFLSGADLIAAIRSGAATQGETPPPVMVVTAASRQRANEAGADAVIAKPFDIATIEMVMRQLLHEEPD